MYVVASKLPNGLDLGDGVVLKGAMLGHEDHQKANAPDRERIAGFEITRNVPDDVWNRWFADNRNSPIIRNSLVMGFDSPDDQQLNEFCWQNQKVKGWGQATQGNSQF